MSEIDFDHLSPTSKEEWKAIIGNFVLGAALAAVLGGAIIWVGVQLAGW